MRKSSADLAAMRRGVGAWLQAAGALVVDDEIGALVPAPDVEARPAIVRALLLGWAHWPPTRWSDVRYGDPVAGASPLELVESGRAFAVGDPSTLADELRSVRDHATQLEADLVGAHDEAERLREELRVAEVDLEILRAEVDVIRERAAAEASAHRAAIDAAVAAERDRADRAEEALRLATMQAEALVEEVAAGRPDRDPIAHPAVGDTWAMVVGSTRAMTVIGVEADAVTVMRVSGSGRRELARLDLTRWAAYWAADRPGWSVYVPNGAAAAPFIAGHEKVGLGDYEADQWGAAGILDQVCVELLGRPGRWEWEYAGWRLDEAPDDGDIKLIRVDKSDLSGRWVVSAIIGEKRISQRAMGPLREALAGFIDQLREPAPVNQAPKKKGKKQ